MTVKLAFSLLAAVAAIGLTSLCSLSSWAQVPAGQRAVCNPRGLAFNAIATNQSVIVGQTTNRPYLVVVPGQRTEVLNRVRQCIPDAFITRSRRGYYIQAGGFSTRNAAKSIVWTLRFLGINNARIIRVR